MRSLVEQRLRNSYLTRRGPRDPVELVAWFGAMQAQEYGPAKWGIGLRLASGATDAAIHRVIDAGRILRTHVLRPTWHFVAAEDIRWMLELTGPNVHRRMAPYDHQLGLDPPVKRRATRIFERALRDGAFLTRPELGEHLGRAGLNVSGNRMAHLTMYAELECVICSGPRRGKQLTYGLVALRAPRARSLPRDEALAELTARFVRSHGPATIRDFVWWSGLSTPDARRGLAMIGARATSVEGLTYWSRGRARPAAASAERVDLLPIYDEYLVAYRDRIIVPHLGYTYGRFYHPLVSGGQVVGTWRPQARRGRIEVACKTLTPLKRGLRAALDQAIERYQNFAAG